MSSVETSFNLLISFWDPADPKRSQELFFCLHKNLDNPYIRRIILFYDGNKNHEEFNHPKILIVPCQEYPTFKLFIEYASKHFPGECIIVSNTDIFFDHTLGLLNDYNFDNTVLALTRHDICPQYDHKGRLSKRLSWSQDSWIFRVPITKFFDDVCLGYLGCENLIAYEMKAAGLRVLNPSLDIKNWHVHDNRKIIRDEHNDPKSYFPLVWDKNYNYFNRGTMVPCEPLGPWTLHTVYQPFQEKLYQERSLATLKDAFKVEAFVVQLDSYREFPGSDEKWVADIFKARKISETLKNLEDDALFIYFEPGVQFFASIQDKIRSILSADSSCIFLMQGAFSYLHNRPSCLTGFVVCRAGEYSRKFWSQVCEYMILHRIGIEEALNDMPKEPKFFTFLPKSFWAEYRGCDEFPADILLHYVHGVDYDVQQEKLRDGARKKRLLEAKGILQQMKNNEKPVLSVITPVLNGDKHIEFCIKNVIAQGMLNQIEHIIYDRGSTDKTLDIVKQYAKDYAHIRLFSVGGTARSKAMNEAIKVARGSIVAILNEDSFYSPGVLKDVIEEFKELPLGSFIIGNDQVLNEKNEVERINKYLNLNFNDLVWSRMECPWNSSSYFYHKLLHQKIGYYDENDNYAMNLDFLLRVLPLAHLAFRDQNWGNSYAISGAKTFEDITNTDLVKIKQKVFDRYRKEEILKFPQRLPGSLWGITTYFNIDGDENRYSNYSKFRTSSQSQGLKLIAVELEFNDHPFELKEGDADILIQIRGTDKNIIWQKETLMNIALKNLPDDCDKVAWIDGDVIFKNENWVQETSRLLETYNVVQPYSWVVYLSEGQEEVDPATVPFGFGEGKQVYSMAYRVAECGQSVIEHYFEKNGHVGFAWACRRSIIEQLFFFEYGIFHNSDSLMAFSFYGSWVYRAWPVNSYLPWESVIWAQRAWYLIRGSVYYCPGVIMHLWHGNIESRIYNTQRQDYLFGLLQRSGFNFNKELNKNKDGLWEWENSSGGDFQEELKRFYKAKPFLGVAK